MTENEKSLYDKAIKKWGVDSQVYMAYEEMGELLSALNKLLRKRVTVDDVITEIADVQIMTEQLALIFGQDKVSTEKDRKLKRLEERLKN
jgi:NTP pyrophosphatase (non-canonical NTP hydrolase)